MPKVKLLSKETAELIAAGEVIERPASIVKELLENAVDSGATSITLEIKQGGVGYIRIADNGCGIDFDDVPTAFLRHATSKINDRHDLEKISTLGFRGEALASVCAVSKVEVLTKTSGTELGTHYIINNSEEILHEQCGCPDGTTIIVRDIFQNVPARLKFLKKDVTEGNAIADITSKIAISHPEISFRFIRDNKQEFFSPNGDLYSAVYAIMGKQFAASMLNVDYELNGIKVEGFTVKPLFGQHNRAKQLFFVNGRYIKAYACGNALEEAYKNTIMDGKFPACVLKITMPPHLYDVNVHPAKIEVRFSDEHILREAIYFAVKNCLLLDAEPAQIKLPERIADYTRPLEFEESPNVVQTEINSPVKFNTFTDNTTNNDSKPHKYVTVNADSFTHIPKEYFNNSVAVTPNPPDNSSISEENKPKDFKILGEAFGNYILAQLEEEILIADKHAAHERILFERLKSGEQDLECQFLFHPEDILLSSDEALLLKENSALFEEIGFAFRISEDADGKDYLAVISGVPALLDRFEPATVFAEILGNIAEHKHNPKPKILDEIYHTIACKAAIKSGDVTQAAEMEHIVKTLLENENIRYCPHGRPVMFKLTKRELEKQFKRI